MKQSVLLPQCGLFVHTSPCFNAHIAKQIRLKWAQKRRPRLSEGALDKRLLKDFPDELRSDITMHLNKEILELSVFSSASRGCLRSLSLHIKTTFCAPGEYLLRQGDALQALFFVCSGSMEVLKDGMVLAILGKGDLIGANMSIEDRVVKTNADVKSLTYCDLQCINLRGLYEVLDLYPEYSHRFCQDIQQDLTYNLREGHESHLISRIMSSKVVDPQVDGRGNGGVIQCYQPIREQGDEEQEAEEAEEDEEETVLFLSDVPNRRHTHTRSTHTHTHTHRTSKSIHIQQENMRKPDLSNLSPRIVDGTEESNSTESSPTFTFSAVHGAANATATDMIQISTAELAAKAEETRGQLCHLDQEVTSLGREVAELSRVMRSLAFLMESLLTSPHAHSTCSPHYSPPLPPANMHPWTPSMPLFPPHPTQVHPGTSAGGEQLLPPRLQDLQLAPPPPPPPFSSAPSPCGLLPPLHPSPPSPESWLPARSRSLSLETPPPPPPPHPCHLNPGTFPRTGLPLLGEKPLGSPPPPGCL
ncbi:hypothetical protein AALO_G00261860 [Alosa alosa]|uniref:Cyclic nucleotide-binding domain-containing protein n=1 Tax=Alosa alosa TaxID=278164 RepID=A0AAV6FTR3_9TELE|nr:hypothetical protein AALO_G00261860 [Alosa alosa]